MPERPTETPNTLGDMVRRYLNSLPPEKRDVAIAEVQQFVRWFGSDRPLVESSIPEIGNYGEQVSSSATEPVKKLQPVKDFLAHAYKHKWTAANFSPHLKQKRTNKTSPAARAASNPTVTLTDQGYVEISTELARLIAERPGIAEELEKARADRDFRENAPLDAAREHQAQVEARIRELETIIKSSTVVTDAQPAASRISIGATVWICDLTSNEETCYTLVSSREANPMKGKLSNESPTGKNLIGRSEGDVVEVTAPAGVMRYRIKKVAPRRANSA